MTPPRGINITRLEIIQTAIRLFFEKGFSHTTAAMLCKEVGISTGNLTFYFPTKEHILDVLVEMLCDFQWKMMEAATDEGQSSLVAYCLEFTTMAAISEENEQMKDFYVSSYRSATSIETIRANDVEKIMKVFGGYRKGWTRERFVEAECIVSGIEYATLMTTAHSAPLKERVTAALNVILRMFGVPEEICSATLLKVSKTDYLSLGKMVLASFQKFTEEATENAIEEKINSIRKRR